MGADPFECGTQYSDWQERNCFGCRKYLDVSPHESSCEMEQALMVAGFTDDELPDDLLRRIGATEHAGEYTWDCPEREAE